MKSVLLAALAAVLLSAPALAQSKPEPPEVDAFDIFVDNKPYVGKTLRITGCTLFNAKRATTNCAVASPNGSQVGSLLIDMAKTDAGTRREILEKCAGDDFVEDCDVDTVTARLRVRYGTVPLLEGAKIAWPK